MTELHSVMPSDDTDGEVVLVALTALSSGDSPRSRLIDPDHVALLVEVVPDVPPILVDRGTMVVIDGHHRVAAATQLGLETIAVQFFDGDAVEALICAIRRNTTHGKPLTVSERKRGGERLLRESPALSDRAVAEICGLSTPTVAGLRSSGSTGHLPSRVGRDGKARPVDPVPGRERAAEILRMAPATPLRVVAERARTSVGTARDVKRRLLAGDSIVPKRYRPRDAEFDPPPARQPEESLAQWSAPEELAGSDQQLRDWLGSHWISDTEWDRLVLRASSEGRQHHLVEYARGIADMWSRFVERARVGSPGRLTTVQPETPD